MENSTASAVDDLARDLAEANARADVAEAKLGLYTETLELYAVALRVLEDANVTEGDLKRVRDSDDPVRALKAMRDAPPPIPVTLLPTPVPVAFSWTEEQEIALDAVSCWLEGDEPFFSLIGPAGSGKTTLAKEIVERHFAGSALAAMTGKAALRLSQLTERPATTLHSILYYPPQPGADLRFTRLREPPANLVLVDESSQMTPSVKEDMQAWADQGVRFLLLGDTYQLPPVITGKEVEKWGEDYTVFGHIDGTILKTVMRNAGGVLRAATKVRETGEICERSDLDSVGSGYEFIRCANSLEKAVDSYLEDPGSSFLITWRNLMRMKANQIVRERLGFSGPLPDDGEPVVLKRNGSGFLNGEIVICRGFEDGPRVGSLKTLWMKVGEGLSEKKLLVSVEGGKEADGGQMMDGGMPWIVDWRSYHTDLKRNCLLEPCPITWAHCLSGHGVQGSQAKRAIVFLVAGDDRNRAMRRMTTLPDGSTASMLARWVYTTTTRSERYTKMLVGR